MKSFEPNKFREEVKNATLAFVDFTKAKTRNWSDCELGVLVNFIATMQKTHDMVIVFSVHPGALHGKIHLALDSVAADRKLTLHLEYGSYSRLVKDPLAGRF